MYPVNQQQLKDLYEIAPPKKIGHSYPIYIYSSAL